MSLFGFMNKSATIYSGSSTKDAYANETISWTEGDTVDCALYLGGSNLQTQGEDGLILAASHIIIVPYATTCGPITSAAPWRVVIDSVNYKALLVEAAYKDRFKRIHAALEM